MSRSLQTPYKHLHRHLKQLECELDRSQRELSERFTRQIQRLHHSLAEGRAMQVSGATEQAVPKTPAPPAAVTLDLSSIRKKLQTLEHEFQTDLQAYFDHERKKFVASVNQHLPYELEKNLSLFHYLLSKGWRIFLLLLLLHLGLELYQSWMLKTHVPSETEWAQILQNSEFLLRFEANAQEQGDRRGC